MMNNCWYVSNIVVDKQLTIQTSVSAGDMWHTQTGEGTATLDVITKLVIIIHCIIIIIIITCTLVYHYYIFVYMCCMVTIRQKSMN